MPGRLRLLEVAAGRRGQCAGSATVQDTTRGPAQVKSEFTIDCQSALGKGLRGRYVAFVYIYTFATGWCEFHFGALCVKRKITLPAFEVFVNNVIWMLLQE